MMADEIRLNTVANTSGAERAIDSLKLRIESLKTALAGLNQQQLGGAAGVASVFTALNTQLSAAEAQLTRLQASFISNFSSIEGFSTRAIAAMRGQADAVKGVAREFTEADRIYRSGIGRVAYGAIDPVALRVATKPNVGAARAVQQREFEEAFGGIETRTAEQMARQAVTDVRAAMAEATGTAVAMGAGMREVAASSTVATREVRHVVGIFDEIKRGQFGAVFSSIGAGLRDAGLGATAIYTGIGALVAVGVLEGLHRMAVNAGELAEKTQIAASAAGVSIEKFSQLSGIMQMAGGSSATLDRALEITTRQLQEAISDPVSKARAGFAAMGFTREDLEQGMGNPIAFLEELRQKFQSMPDSGQKTEMFIAALGREFRVFQSYLTLSAKSFDDLNAAQIRTQSTLTGPTADALRQAARAEGEMDKATEGLKNALSLLASDSGVTNYLTRVIEQLIKGTMEWANYFAAMKNGPPAPDLSSIGAFMRTGGVPGTLTGMPGLATQGVGTGTATVRDSHIVAGGALTTGVDSNLVDTFNKTLAALNMQAVITSGAGGHHASGSQHYAGNTASGMGEALDFDLLDSAGQVIGHSAAKIIGSDQYNAYKTFGDTFKRLSPGTGRSGMDFAQTDPGHVDFGLMSGAPPGVRAGQLAAGGALGSVGGGIPQLGGLKELSDELAREMKKIEDETKLVEAQFNARIKTADVVEHDPVKGANITAERERFLAEQQRKTEAAQSEFRSKATGGGFTSSEVDKYADPTQAKVAAINAQTQVTTATQEAKDKQYQEAKELAELQIAEARRSAQEIITSSKSSSEQKIAAEENFKSQVSAINTTLMAQASTIYNQGNKEYLRLTRERVDAERQASSEIARLHKQGIEEQLRDAGRLTQTLQTQRVEQRAGFQVQEIQAQAGGGSAQSVSRIQIEAAQKDAQLAQQIANVEIEAYQKVMNSADVSSEERKQAEEKIAQIRAKTIQEEIADYQKALTAYEKASAATTKFFDSLGSTLESSLNSALTQRQTYSQWISKLLNSAISDGAKFAESTASTFIGNMLKESLKVPGEGIGQVLGNWVMKSIGTAMPSLKQFIPSAITDVTGATTQATAITTAMTAGATAAIPAMTAAFVAAAAGASAGSGAGSGIGAVSALLPTLAFSRGGIVASAAGGMITGAGGASLAILHPREMVLPAHISEGIQNMISSHSSSNSSGGNHTFNYAPQMSGRFGSGFSRSEVGGMLRNHGSEFEGMARNMIRNGFRG